MCSGAPFYPKITMIAFERFLLAFSNHGHRVLPCVLRVLCDEYIQTTNHSSDFLVPAFYIRTNRHTSAQKRYRHAQKNICGKERTPGMLSRNFIGLKVATVRTMKAYIHQKANVNNIIAIAPPGKNTFYET